MLVRQAHPGPGVPPYQTVEQKLGDAQRYVAEERIPWLVIVDDVAGTTHRAYGGLADPTYLIGTDGRVSFANLVTHVPTLDWAVSRLLWRGGRGVVDGGWHRRPHLLAPFVDGWRALQRGHPRASWS